MPIDIISGKLPKPANYQGAGTMNMILISLILTVATLQPHAVSMEEFLQSECNKGVQKDCENLAELRKQ